MIQITLGLQFTTNMIGKIKNKTIRRIVLISTLPLTVPLALLTLFLESAPKIFKEMFEEIVECWYKQHE